MYLIIITHTHIQKSCALSWLLPCVFRYLLMSSDVVLCTIKMTPAKWELFFSSMVGRMKGLEHFLRMNQNLLWGGVFFHPLYKYI